MIPNRITTISIISISTRHILGVIRKEQLTYRCLDISPDDQLIIQINYTDQQQELINDMYRYIQECESIQEDMARIIDAALKDQNNRLQELRINISRERNIQDKQENELTADNSTTDGNDKQS